MTMKEEKIKVPKTINETTNETFCEPVFVKISDCIRKDCEKSVYTGNGQNELKFEVNGNIDEKKEKEKSSYC